MGPHCHAQHSLTTHAVLIPGVGAGHSREGSMRRFSRSEEARLAGTGIPREDKGISVGSSTGFFNHIRSGQLTQLTISLCQNCHYNKVGYSIVWIFMSWPICILMRSFAYSWPNYILMRSWPSYILTGSHDVMTRIHIHELMTQLHTNEVDLVSYDLT